MKQMIAIVLSAVFLVANGGAFAKVGGKCFKDGLNGPVLCNEGTLGCICGPEKHPQNDMKNH